MRARLSVVAGVALWFSACAADEPLAVYEPPPPEPPGPCGAACLEAVWLLTTSGVVHVLDGEGEPGAELASFAAPPGTVSIAHDGARLLALSPAGVDALDDLDGRVLEHVADLTGRHIAAMNGRVAVASGRFVTFVDNEVWLADEEIAELYEYKGALAYETGAPVLLDGDLEWESWMHLLVDGDDIDTGCGRLFAQGPTPPMGSDGDITLVEPHVGYPYGVGGDETEQIVWSTDAREVVDAAVFATGPWMEVPVGWHALDITAR